MHDDLENPKTYWVEYPREVMQRGHVLNDEEVRLMTDEIERLLSDLAAATRRAEEAEARADRLADVTEQYRKRVNGMHPQVTSPKRGLGSSDHVGIQSMIDRMPDDIWAVADEDVSAQTIDIYAQAEPGGFVGAPTRYIRRDLYDAEKELRVTGFTAYEAELADLRDQIEIAKTESYADGEATDSNMGGGRFEVSTEGDGKVMLSAMADDGEWQWYVMPPDTAANLAADLMTMAAQAVEDMNDD
ncbi:MAG: hypothetical protein Unbinned3138contig1000_58 [Prokaryotic dsDNA virus sp.]|nr:MAG: hypothetical protein Unbinned3138contig1000_58 [Prokaryotic dsDNA virus sp.]